MDLTRTPTNPTRTPMQASLMWFSLGMFMLAHVWHVNFMLFVYFSFLTQMQFLVEYGLIGFAQNDLNYENIPHDISIG